MTDTLHILLLDDRQLLTIHHAISCKERLMASEYMKCLLTNDSRGHLQELLRLASLIKTIEAVNDFQTTKDKYQLIQT